MLFVTSPYPGPGPFFQTAVVGHRRSPVMWFRISLTYLAAELHLPQEAIRCQTEDKFYLFRPIQTTVLMGERIVMSTNNA